VENNILKIADVNDSLCEMYDIANSTAFNKLSINKEEEKLLIFILKANLPKPEHFSKEAVSDMNIKLTSLAKRKTSNFEYYETIYSQLYPIVGNQESCKPENLNPNSNAKQFLKRFKKNHTAIVSKFCGILDRQKNIDRHEKIEFTTELTGYFKQKRHELHKSVVELREHFNKSKVELEAGPDHLKLHNIASLGSTN